MLGSWSSEKPGPSQQVPLHIPGAFRLKAGVRSGRVEILGSPRHRFTLKADGSGLGLITVDSLIRACGGTLQLSNRAEGGAQVDVFLPVAPKAESAEAPESAA